MAELDYAFLADHAQILDGKITAVGASFTHVSASAVPGVLVLSVAGRIRAAQGEAPLTLSVKFVPPAEEYELEVTGALEEVNVRPYNGKVGLLFAAQNLQIPLPSYGLYQALISVDGRQVRRLAFDVESA